MDNGNCKSSSSEINGNNVFKLVPLAEQLQLTNQVGGPRFCDDVLLDVLHFLRRNEQAHIRLASRRLQWLSDTACARYSPHVVPRLEVRGVYASPLDTGVPQAEPLGPQIVANSMRVHPVSGDSYLANFPSMEPLDDIVLLSELEIYDLIGPELLQFLGLSARLLGECWIMFNDFDSFVRHHSVDFISRFFGLFPSANRIVGLKCLSSLAVPLFRDNPAMFGCTDLYVECLDTFPLDAFQGWLHLDEQQPLEQQKERYLGICFGDQVHVDHSVDSIDHLVQQIRQRFSNATSCCPFFVEIRLSGGPHIPRLELFTENENNQRTGEQLEFHWHCDHVYLVKRSRRESMGKGEGDKEAKTEEKQKDKTLVYIHGVMQGDKQPEDSEH